MNTTSPVLLYDGECGLCAGSVQFLLKRESSDRREHLRFAPLQGVFGDTVRTRHPVTATIDSIVWYEPLSNGSSRISVKSTAALNALSHLGGLYRWLARLGALVPRPVRDAVYDAVARRRKSLVASACVLPSANERARFLA